MKKETLEEACKVANQADAIDAILQQAKEKKDKPVLVLGATLQAIGAVGLVDGDESLEKDLADFASSAFETLENILTNKKEQAEKALEEL